MMKKIFLLIAILLLASGCYDYKEINDLAVVSAIGIDYKDNNYLVTLEVLNDKQDKDSANISSYIKNGSGITLTDAIENASDKITKGTNFSHVKLMVLGSELLKNNFENIIDLFLRNTYFRENFYVIGSINDTPSELLSQKNDSLSVASDEIIMMLENMNYSSNSDVLVEFDKIVKDSLTDGIDTCFSNVSFDNDGYFIDGLIVFKGFKYKKLLSNEDAKIFNLLSNRFERPSYTIKYDDKFFTVAINDGKLDVKIDNGYIKVSGNLMGRIIDNDVNFDIRNNEILEKINRDFSKLINEKIISFIKQLQNNHSDILGISMNNYKINRIDDYKYWEYLDVVSKINFYINKKGLIYEK